MSADEAAVCDVARDMVEEGRPLADVVALLNAQAPNRLKRPCPACGVIEEPCIEVVDDIAIIQSTDSKFGGKAIGLRDTRYLTVPHASRVEPNGPLFGGAVSHVAR